MARRPDQLPAGLHGLGRGHVARHQRRRVLIAVSHEMAVRGYDAITVEIIREKAGISRRTFYDHFADKEAAIVALHEAATAQLLEAIDSATSATAGRALPDVVAAAVAAAVELIRRNPNAARTWLMATGRSSERLADARTATLTALEDRLRDVLVAADHSAPSRASLAVAIGGVCEVVRCLLNVDTSEPQSAEMAEIPGLLLGLAAPRRLDCTPRVVHGHKNICHLPQ